MHLLWPPVIGSHFHALYASNHLCNMGLRRPNDIVIIQSGQGTAHPTWCVWTNRMCTVYYELRYYHRLLTTWDCLSSCSSGLGTLLVVDNRGRRSLVRTLSCFHWQWEGNAATECSGSSGGGLSEVTLNGQSGGIYSQRRWGERKGSVIMDLGGKVAAIIKNVIERASIERYKLWGRQAAGRRTNNLARSHCCCVADSITQKVALIKV